MSRIQKFMAALKESKLKSDYRRSEAGIGQHTEKGFHYTSDADTAKKLLEEAKGVPVDNKIKDNVKANILRQVLKNIKITPEEKAEDLAEHNKMVTENLAQVEANRVSEAKDVNKAIEGKVGKVRTGLPTITGTPVSLHPNANLQTVEGEVVKRDLKTQVRQPKRTIHSRTSATPKTSATSQKTTTPQAPETKQPKVPEPKTPETISTPATKTINPPAGPVPTEASNPPNVENMPPAQIEAPTIAAIQQQNTPEAPAPALETQTTAAYLKSLIPSQGKKATQI